MKFTDLTSAQRSMLHMLCSNNTGWPTDVLGRGCMPKFKPDQAASSLLGLRDMGLVYSNQKPSTQPYAMWKASAYGMAVFAGRPADVAPPVEPTPATVEKPFRVLQVRDDGITLFATAFNDIDTADRFARTNIHGQRADAVNYIVTLHKSMRYIAPVAAGVQVEEL